jgi:hypothetical protein
MNGELCQGCDYVTHHSGNGLQHQECNYPIKSHVLVNNSKMIYYMYEEDCPLKQENTKEGVKK